MVIRRCKQLTGRDRSDSNPLSLWVASRITLGSEDDRDGRTWFCLDVHSVQSVFGASLIVVKRGAQQGEKMLRTYQCDLGEIGIFTQEEHQGFCFGVSEPHVVLEDFGTILSYHEPGE